jgi:hypothetical protein
MLLTSLFEKAERALPYGFSLYRVREFLFLHAPGFENKFLCGLFYDALPNGRMKWRGFGRKWL